jgi:hypothetical protein
MNHYSIITLLLLICFFPCAIHADLNRTPDVLDHPRFLKTIVVNESGRNSPAGETVVGDQNSPGTESVVTFTFTPTRTPPPKKYEKPPVKTSAARLPQVTTIPNPAWGKKMTFRIMAENAVDVRIRIYNRNLDPVDELKKSGLRYFDILWNLTLIPEGLYYYQTQIVDKVSGEIKNIPVQKFVVLKKEQEKQKPKKAAARPTASDQP